jgi:hypothetical protein
MNEEEFLVKWRSEKSAYEAWASFVKEKIESALTLEHETLQLDYSVRHFIGASLTQMHMQKSKTKLE